MNEVEKIEKISQMGIGELQLRRKMINFAIRLCIQEGDPHQQTGNYKGQLMRIDNEIKKRKEGQSPVLTIKAQPGRMGAKIKR